jgi:hypothetical protein
VTGDMPPERADLVDAFYAPFVRPLGNLVVLFAQPEAAWLELVAELSGCTEKEAQGFLQKKPSETKQEIISLAQISGIEGFDLQELSEGIENYFCDRERRHRLFHDEWYLGGLSRVPPEAVPSTRGLPRKKDAVVVWDNPTPDDVWQLARRFRDYEHLFSFRTYDLRRRKGSRAPRKIAPAADLCESRS